MTPNLQFPTSGQPHGTVSEAAKLDCSGAATSQGSVLPGRELIQVETNGALSESVLEHRPGGPDPEQFNWLEAWHPVHYVSDLDKSKLTRFTLLGQDLVIWWDVQAETWRVFRDRCPHRLVPLSQGRIAADGLLECPYHGWAFGGSGECLRIPQQPAGGQAETSPRACATAYPTAVRQGLLFVYPGQPERAAATPIPIIEAMAEDTEDWVCLNTFRDLPYDALTLLENVLDSSHVPFTHHGTVGNRANAGPVNLEVVTADRQGFAGVWPEGPRQGKLGRQETVFIAPNFMAHDLTSKQFGRTLTVVYATPIRPGECRLFARFPFRFPSKFPGWVMKRTPEWISHLRQNAILEEDQIFLHYQERYLAAAGGGGKHHARAFYLPTAADRFVSGLHQWLDRYQAWPFPGQSLPAPQPDEVLLDRYQSHTVHCASCRGALAKLQTLRRSLAAVAVGLWAILPVLVAGGWLNLLAAALMAGGLVAVSAAWWQLGRLERPFYQGRAVPKRNQSVA